MTEQSTAKPAKPGPRPKPSWAPAPPGKTGNPEEWVEIAKKAVLDNYNTARDESHAPELQATDLYIVWYCRTLQNWQAIITSPVARRLYWIVIFNSYRNEVYLNVHQKINSVKIPLGEKVPS